MAEWWSKVLQNTRKLHTVARLEIFYGARAKSGRVILRGEKPQSPLWFRNYMNRELDGIYIRAQDENGKWTALCLSDCSEEQRTRWLETLEKDALIQTVNILASTIRKLGEEFDIRSEPVENENYN